MPYSTFVACAGRQNRGANERWDYVTGFNKAAERPFQGSAWRFHPASVHQIGVSDPDAFPGSPGPFPETDAPPHPWAEPVASTYITLYITLTCQKWMDNPAPSLD
jgi:hypothetical protein